MRLKRSTVLVSTLAVLGSGAVVVASSAAADPATAGTYNVLPSTRIVNTAAGIGAPKAAIAAGATLSIAGTAGLGTQSVSALDLEIGVVSPSATGFLVAYSGTSRPNTSTINFTPGETTPNDAAVKVDSTGTVKLYNGSAGTIQVTVDRQGYWTGGAVSETGGAFVATTPQRAVDSRSTETGPIEPRETTTVRLPDLPDNATSVLVNVAAASPTAAGFLTVTGGEDQTDDTRTSSLSFTARRSRAALVHVPVTDTDTITLHNGSDDNLNYVVDLYGYLTNGVPSAGGAEIAASPVRIDDSRTGTDAGPIAAKGTRKIQVLPADGPTTDDVTAVVVGVTSTHAEQRGYLTAWSGTAPRPGTSFSAFSADTNRTATIVVPLAADGSITIYNGATSSVDVVTDLQGLVVANFDTSNGAAINARVARTFKHIRATAAENLDR